MNLTDNGIEEINTRAFSRNQLLGKIFITKTPHLYTKVTGCLSVYVSKIIEGEWAMCKSAPEFLFGLWNQPIALEIYTQPSLYKLT